LFCLPGEKQVNNEKTKGKCLNLPGNFFFIPQHYSMAGNTDNNLELATMEAGEYVCRG